MKFIKLISHLAKHSYSSGQQYSSSAKPHISPKTIHICFKLDLKDSVPPISKGSAVNNVDGSNDLEGSAQHHRLAAKGHMSAKRVYLSVKTEFILHINSRYSQNTIAV